MTPTKNKRKPRVKVNLRSSLYMVSVAYYQHPIFEKMNVIPFPVAASRKVLMNYMKTFDEIVSEINIDSKIDAVKGVPLRAIDVYAPTEPYALIIHYENGREYFINHDGTLDGSGTDLRLMDEYNKRLNKIAGEKRRSTKLTRAPQQKKPTKKARVRK